MMVEQYFRGVRSNGYVRGVGRKYRDTRNGEHVVLTGHMCDMMGLPRGTAVSFAHPPVREVEITDALRAEIMARHGYTDNAAASSVGVHGSVDIPGREGA